LRVLGIRRSRRIASRIENASAANTAQCLEALLFGVVIALGVAIIVHDGAPWKVLGENSTTDEQTCGDEICERECAGSVTKSQDAGAPVLAV
jgi:hypothetical protein